MKAGIVINGYIIQYKTKMNCYTIQNKTKINQLKKDDEHHIITLGLGWLG